MLAAILVTAVIQGLLLSCHAIDTTLLNSTDINATLNSTGLNATLNSTGLSATLNSTGLSATLNSTGLSATLNNTSSVTGNNTVNLTNSSIDSNTTIDSNSTIDTNSTEVLTADSSSVEEVVLSSTPVMTDCVNATMDPSSECMVRMFNLTMECANQTEATSDDVDIAMRMEIPSSDTGKCLTRCLLKHRGVMSPEGAFAANATANFLTEVNMDESLRPEFQKLADYCYGKLKLQPMSSLDTCQFAYDIALCTEEYHKTLFLRNPAMAPPVNAITTP